MRGSAFAAPGSYRAEVLFRQLQIAVLGRPAPTPGEQAASASD